MGDFGKIVNFDNCLVAPTTSYLSLSKSFEKKDGKYHKHEVSLLPI